MTDRLRLDGLRVFARHGVLAAEADMGQIFVVDLELELDLRGAASSDDVNDAVDYGILATEVVDVVTNERWNLIERVAERVAESVLSRESVDAVTVTVHKPGAPIAVAFSDVSVTITRRRD